jgi:hypothetical protein
MERILASEGIREKQALLEGRREIEGGRLELVQLAARLIIEDALEGEARTCTTMSARTTRSGSWMRSLASWICRHLASRSGELKCEYKDSSGVKHSLAFL